MPYHSEKEIPVTDYRPMWDIYLNYLKKLLPWEQRTVVINRTAILEMTQLDDGKGAKRGRGRDANRSGKST